MQPNNKAIDDKPAASATTRDGSELFELLWQLDQISEGVGGRRDEGRSAGGDRGRAAPMDDIALTALAVDAARIARKLERDPHALARACVAIASVARLSTTYNLKGMLAGELGCMQLLLEAMDNHSYNQHADLHEPAIEALHYMTINHQDNATLFLGLRGLTILVKTMRDPYCIQNVEYQTHACGVIENLARWPVSHATLQASGGLHALCDAIRAHPENDSVLQTAYGALKLISERVVGR
jgi:hypothetical protein